MVLSKSEGLISDIGQGDSSDVEKSTPGKMSMILTLLKELLPVFQGTCDCISCFSSTRCTCMHIHHCHFSVVNGDNLAVFWKFLTVSPTCKYDLADNLDKKTDLNGLEIRWDES